MAAVLPPEWARAAPRPWQSFEDPRRQPASSSSLSHDLRASVPIDVVLPADCEWHQLPDTPGAAAAAKRPAGFSKKPPGPAAPDVSSRRAARRARDARAIARTAMQSGEAAPDAGSDAVWEARKQRIHSLLARLPLSNRHAGSAAAAAAGEEAPPQLEEVRARFKLTAALLGVPAEVVAQGSSAGATASSGSGLAF